LQKINQIPIAQELSKTHRKRKVWLTSQQVEEMAGLAKQKNPRDYLLITLMRYGLRCGEIVGWRGLPGIRVEDIRAEGIWVKGKGYARGIVQDRLVPMPRTVMSQLRNYALSKQITNGESNKKVFPISEVRAEQIVKQYARSARIQDWDRVGPHRLRAYFATDAKDRGFDAFTIRDLMRHKNISTTNLYVGQSSTERLAKIVEEISST
jgi:site-specific recombinase XerD